MASKGIKDGSKKDLSKPINSELKKMDTILETFIKGFKDYRVDKLIQANPQEPIKAYLIMDSIQFIGYMRNQISVNNIIDKRNYVHHTIVQFVDTLFAYLLNLKDLSLTSDIKNNGYNPKDSISHRQIEISETISLNERDRNHINLKSIMQMLDAEISRQLSECTEEDRVKFKNEWDTNVGNNIFSPPPYQRANEGKAISD